MWGWRRARVSAFLKRRRVKRAAVVFGLGPGLAWLVRGALIPVRNKHEWLTILLHGLLGLGLGALVGCVTAVMMWALLTFIRRLADPCEKAFPPWMRRHPFLSFVLTTSLLSSLPAYLLAFSTLQGLVVFVFGLWGGWLIHRRVRARRAWWVRHLPDGFVALLIGTGTVLVSISKLPIDLAVVLLFPIGVWLSGQVWLVLKHSHSRWPRAGADLVLSLSLGSNLLLLLLWAANFLGMSPGEVSALRDVLRTAGTLADVPWWWVTAFYAVLAVTNLAFALWPRITAPISRLLRQLHMVPVTNASRRLLSGVHIGLLLVAFIGITGTSVLAPVLRGQLVARYSLAVQQEQTAIGERVAYTEVAQRFATPASTPVPQGALTPVFEKIHLLGTQDPAHAPRLERDLAARTGRLQARSLVSSPTPPPVSTTEAETLRQFHRPIRDSGDFVNRLDLLTFQQQRASEAGQYVRRAADLAVNAVASALQLPQILGQEATEIVKEYLGGLIENSPLATVLAAWAQHFPGYPAPPDPEQLIVPDLTGLEKAANTQLTEELAQAGFVNPAVPDPAREAALKEAPADAVVDLLNQQLDLENTNTACGGCASSFTTGQEGGENGIEGEEPPVDVPELPVK